MPVFRAGSFSSYEIDLDSFVPEGETVTEIWMPITPDEDGVFGIGINDTFDALEGTPPEGEEGEYFFDLVVFHSGSATSTTFGIGVKVLP